MQPVSPPDAWHAPDGAAPAPLMVWLQPSGMREHVEAYLSKLLMDETPPETLSDLAEAEDRLGGLPQARLLLVCDAPLAVLVQGMAEGIPPTERLSRWQAEIRDVLRLLRRNRRRATVASTDMIVRNPEGLRRHLALPPLNEATPAPPAPPEDPRDPVLQLLAAEALAKTPAARALAGELEASAPNLGGEGLLARQEDPDSTFQRYQETRRSAAQAEAVLMDQLLHAQEQAEQGYAEARRAEAQAAELRDRFELSDQESSQLRAEVRRLGEDLAKSNEQTARLQNDVQSARAEAAELRDKVELSDEENSLLREELRETNEKLAESGDDLAKSEEDRRRLERINEQLNQGLESHQVQLRDAEREKAQLLDQLQQLHDLREELEAHFFRAEDAERELARREKELSRRHAETEALTQKREALEARVRDLDSKMKAQAAQISDKEHRIAELQSALDLARRPVTSGPFGFIRRAFTREGDR